MSVCMRGRKQLSYKLQVATYKQLGNMPIFFLIVYLLIAANLYGTDQPNNEIFESIQLLEKMTKMCVQATFVRLNSESRFTQRRSVFQVHRPS
jgi:hypothetical protein